MRVKVGLRVRVEGDEVGWCTTRGRATTCEAAAGVHGRVRRRRGGGEEGGEESGESETLTKLYPQPRAWLKPRPA